MIACHILSYLVIVIFWPSICPQQFDHVVMDALHYSGVSEAQNFHPNLRWQRGPWWRLWQLAKTIHHDPTNVTSYAASLDLGINIDNRQAIDELPKVSNSLSINLRHHWKCMNSPDIRWGASMATNNKQCILISLIHTLWIYDGCDLRCPAIWSKYI